MTLLFSILEVNKIIQEETMFHQFRTKFLWKGSVDLVQKMAKTFFWNSNHQLLDRRLNVTGICLPATRAGELDTWNEAVLWPGMVPQNLKQSTRYVSRPDILPRNAVCSLQRKQFLIPNQKTHSARDKCGICLGLQEWRVKCCQ